MKYKVITTTIGKELEANINRIDKKVAKVGWFEKSRYENGEYVAEIAAQNEFGNPSKNIPARPFISQAIAKDEKLWANILEDQAKLILDGRSTIDKAFEIVGGVAAGSIKESISTLTEPPLSPVTIQRRLQKYKNKQLIGGLTKPLIETAIMLNSVSHVVEGA